jgi:hypothetical protein
MEVGTVNDRGLLADDGYRDVPRVVVARSHTTTDRKVCELINRGCRCWTVTAAAGPELPVVVAELDPDAVIAEGDTEGVRALVDVGARRIMAVGRRHEDRYRIEMLAAGAPAWIIRAGSDTDLESELERFVGGCGCGCSVPAHDSIDSEGRLR